MAHSRLTALSSPFPHLLVEELGGLEFPAARWQVLVHLDRRLDTVGRSRVARLADGIYPNIDAVVEALEPMERRDPAASSASRASRVLPLRSGGSPSARRTNVTTTGRRRRPATEE